MRVSRVGCGDGVRGIPEEPAPTAKRAAVQAAVLAATEALLAEGACYADLSIERIATRAGISRTAFYFYFRDKRELLMRLTEDVNELLFAQADVWFSGDGEPGAELRAALTNIAALYDEHGVLLRAIVEVSTYDEEVARFWRAHDRALRRGDAAGASRTSRRPAGVAEHREATAFALCWMTERAVYQRLVQDEPSPRTSWSARSLRLWVRSVYGAEPLGRLHRHVENTAAEARARDAEFAHPRDRRARTGAPRR